MSSLRSLAACMLIAMSTVSAVDLPARKHLNLAAVKKMVAVAEAEAQQRKVAVSICIMDEAANLLFLQRGDGASLITLQFVQKKARYAAFYGKPSKAAQDEVKGGNTAALAYPEYFPNQGGLPIKVDGELLGSIAVSGAPSEVDEAIAQAAIDALLK